MTSHIQRRFAHFLMICLVSGHLWQATGAFETVTFESEDGLLVTADVYQAHESTATPFIVLFHQAGFSRGEYREIAPRLNALGFNAMAVDQRSGGSVNGVINETAGAAKAAGRPTGFLEAQPDMRAAIAYARDHLASGAVLGWGSSYSSALILKLAAETPVLVDGTLSFSPGEYFSPRNLITQAVTELQVPAFITSARGEANSWAGIFDGVGSAEKVSYIPTTSGNHGSGALWDRFNDSEGYWQAVQTYLERWRLPEKPPVLLIERQPDNAMQLLLPTSQRLYLSRDLVAWTPIGTVKSSGSVTVDSSQLGTAFYRTQEVNDDVPVANIINVSATGSPGAYTFSVRIESPDLGCEQYADWWEVLREDGTLVYRRVLAHSHVNEQPFTRSGGRVDIEPNENVWVRAHMNASGYGGAVYHGSVANGFEEVALPSTFASWAALQKPLPDGCDF